MHSTEQHISTFTLVENRTAPASIETDSMVYGLHVGIASHLALRLAYPTMEVRVVLLYHIISYHMISYHIISYHIILHYVKSIDLAKHILLLFSHLLYVRPCNGSYIRHGRHSF